MIGNVEFFAEVKPYSPSGWQSPYEWDELFELANEVGDVISIHTSYRWGGSFSLISKARNHTTKPILAKGIHPHDDHIKRALDCGANYVLVVGRIPNIHQHRCVIEPLTLDGLSLIPSEFRVAWNARDLVGLFRKIAKLEGERTNRPTFAEARKIRPQGWMCQASNLKTIADIQSDASAVLVGTHLPEFITSLKAS